MKVIVIGGGPAGMMAAISSAESGNEVVILEKMQSLGRKLLITGKGRCNITSSLDMEDFIKNTPGNGMFLYSCYKNFTNIDIIDFLKEQGLNVKEERGHRIFPITDKSQDVLKCFTKKLKELNVEIQYNVKVEEIITEKCLERNDNKKARDLIQNNKVVAVRTENEILKADKVILATGGKSYPLTGSSGDGYKIVEKLGHKITSIKPSLVPLESYNIQECGKLQGLSLRNVGIQLVDKEKNKVIYEDFGEMIFTHFGVSGPTILSSSAHLVRYKDIERLLKEKKIILKIDLKNALSDKKLDERILRDFEEFKNKQFGNSLDKLLPKKLIPVIVERSNIKFDKKVNEITREERKQLVEILKNYEIEIKGFRPIEEAIITSGGIQVNEINPKTMESKIIKGLYFAGEIIDVDSYTGGFNLQIAYSTGYVAGKN